MAVFRYTLIIGLVLLGATLPQGICGIDGGLWGLVVDSAGVADISHGGSPCQPEEVLDNCPCENSVIHQAFHVKLTLKLVSVVVHNGYPPILFQAATPPFRPPILSFNRAFSES
jgi:hypothetical protein